MIPTSHHDLLIGRSVALSTVNDDGTVQTTAVWVDLGDDGILRTSLAKARVKYRNLRKRPQATVFSLSPEDQFHTIEIRAEVAFAADPGLMFFSRLLAPYGQTLETFAAQAAEDRETVIFRPSRIRTSA
ncbi:pyridoxamine 5'-phosphate oxidase family protein [Amycolatopsis jejuensis]|uniref:pyridoxamine 5'-phosphate oxidase family protein n=1 Tax=Amycolatopsis jejuensis TaxID=330084 RepID=UPI0005248B58|nr:pyridoxamine 5'-phosphate oxidase family protein [Amycolatopsis jejuensis]